MCKGTHAPTFESPSPKYYFLVILQCFPSPNYQSRLYAPAYIIMYDCLLHLLSISDQIRKKDRIKQFKTGGGVNIRIIFFKIYFRDLCEFSSCVKKYPDNATKCKYILELLYLHNQIQNQNHNNNTVISLSEHLKVMNVSEYFSFWNSTYNIHIWTDFLHKKLSQIYNFVTNRGRAISRCSQCSITGVTKAAVCIILYWDGAYKRPLAANRKKVAHAVASIGLLIRYMNGPLPYVWRHITVRKMCRVRR